MMSERMDDRLSRGLASATCPVVMPSPLQAPRCTRKAASRQQGKPGGRPAWPRRRPAHGPRRTVDNEDQVVLEPPEGSPEDGVAPDLLFLKVPQDKAVKNRLHLDLRPVDRDAEVARLEALGARRIDVGQREVSWVVMADPEGNEFDVLRALTRD